MNTEKIDSFVNGYLVTALWSSCDMDAQPLDKDNEIEDISADDIKTAVTDCNLFREKAGSLLDGLDECELGHDFWLTRNGHGAGFWEGDYKEGEKLTDLCKEFGEIHLDLAAR